MKLIDNTGAKLTTSVDFTICELMEKYNLNRTDARKLLAECLVRCCIQDEIEKTARVLLGLNE